MWIETKGKQHRVYWRTGLTVPARGYEAFATHDQATSFIELARRFQLAPARAYVQNPTPQALAELVGRRIPAPRPDYSPPQLPAAGHPCTQDPNVVAASLPPTSFSANLTGVTFDVVLERFLERTRHLEEGTRELYEGYARNHYLPYFGNIDVGLILRSKPLLATNAPPGALYVDDGWVSAMMVKERLSNQRKPISGSLLTLKFIKNALVTLGQVFDVALNERPAVLEVNPAHHIALPKQDRRDMHCLEDAEAYLALHQAMDPHFRPLIDFLVGTGARYGEAAGLLVGAVHLDAKIPYVEIKLALKWRGKKWKLGRPKTKASLRAVSLPPRLVAALRPLVRDKTPEAHVFTMVEGGPLHHGNFYTRYFQPARKAADGVPNSFRIHDLRHTFAGWALSAGVPTLVVMRQLGHSSVTTTMNIYGHVTPAADKQLLALINDLLPVGRKEEDNAPVVTLSPAERLLPMFDIDDDDDLAA